MKGESSRAKRALGLPWRPSDPSGLVSLELAADISSSYSFVTVPTENKLKFPVL